MRKIAVALTILSMLILLVGIVVYVRPWITRIVVLYPEDTSDAFKKLENLFEEESRFTDVELKPYHTGGLTQADLDKVDIVVVSSFDTMESLYRDGYVDWYLETAKRNGNSYYMAVVRDSEHFEHALEFVRLFLSEQSIDVLRSLGYEPTSPAKGFSEIPEGLKEYVLEFKTVIDWFSRRVIIPKTVKRVVSLVPMITISILMMDGGDLLVGVDSVSPTSELIINVYPHIKDIPVAGAPWSINIEHILSLNPDVVLTTGRPMEVVEKFEEVEIPVVIVPMGEMHCNQLPDAIRLIGDAIGRGEAAEEIASYFEEKMETILNVTSKIPRGERPRVYIAIGDGLKTHVSYVSRDMVWIAGGVNVAENLSGPAGGGPPMAPVSMETVFKWNPDVIITWDPMVKRRILSDPKWAEVNAVKNGRVYVMPRGLRSWILPEPEVVLGVMWLSEKLHPDAFSFNMEDEVRQFYQRFLGYELSDEELAKILSGEYGVKIPGV